MSFFLPGLIKCPVCTNSYALKHVSLGDFICNIWVWIEFWSSGARLDFMFWLHIRLGFYLFVWVELWYEHLSSGNRQFGIVFNDWVWWICLSLWILISYWYKDALSGNVMEISSIKKGKNVSFFWPNHVMIVIYSSVGLQFSLAASKFSPILELITSI